jgi:DNA-binding NtrC family response regulator
MQTRTVIPETDRTVWKKNEEILVPVKRVLVVDDEAPMRLLLGKVLEEWSYTPSMAATVREAQDTVLTEKPFSVIVSDYNLPDGNGLGFLDWLRQEIQIHVPFLLISGGMIPAPVVADDYEFLTKPFDLDDFRNCLEKLGGLRSSSGG